MPVADENAKWRLLWHVKGESSRVTCKMRINAAHVKRSQILHIYYASKRSLVSCCCASPDNVHAQTQRHFTFAHFMCAYCMKQSSDRSTQWRVLFAEFVQCEPKFNVAACKRKIQRQQNLVVVLLRFQLTHNAVSEKRKLLFADAQRWH